MRSTSFGGGAPGEARLGIYGGGGLLVDLLLIDIKGIWYVIEIFRISLLAYFSDF